MTGGANFRTKKTKPFDLGEGTMATAGSSGAEANDGRASLEEALESCRTYLLYVAWRIKGSEGVAGAEGASDLVQQTMLVALRKVREGRGPGPTPKDHRAWLRQILINLMREKSRRARREPGGLEVAIADSGTSPSGALAKQEEARAMAEALDRLRPDEREIVTWRCLDGLTYEEIGRRRGYADTYARRVVGQVLGRLRSMIGE
jgi:RNA polymerase sigma factor (sigma-70 family)